MLRRYCQEHDAAFYIKLPFTILKSPKSILLAILQALDVPTVIRYQSEEQLIDIIVAVLHSKQITHLVIDDIQEIEYCRRNLALFDLLKYLTEAANLKFVFAGTDIPELTASVEGRFDILKAV